MIDTQRKVTGFHLKHKFPVNISMKANRGFTWLMMWFIIKMTLWLSRLALRYWKICKVKPESIYRVHLILEEFAEMIEGINKGNLIKTADGLGDLLYVVIGVATVYHLPAHEISIEVCQSNATKQIRTKTNVRLRDKGKDWQPPNFEAAIDFGRGRLDKERLEIDDEQLEADLNCLTCEQLRIAQNRLEDIEDKLKEE